nr:sialate O-acetylesterase [uncultured Pedobacter sp.]
MKILNKIKTYTFLVLALLLVQSTAFSQSQTFTPTDDAMIWQGGQSSNYETKNQMYVKIQSGQSRYSYVKFDLSGFNLNATGRTVVRLYCEKKADNAVSNTINVMAVSDNTWTEATLNYTNAPARESVVGTNTIDDQVGQYYEWDITNYINSLNVTKTSNTILSLAFSDGTTSNNTVYFTTKEGVESQRPELQIYEQASVPKTYYVDADNGNDANDGLSETNAWKSLVNPNSTVLVPGSKILFKAGGAWMGQLTPLGSGSNGQPIIIDQYGTGNKPMINGGGLNGTGTVKLYNQAYIEVNNLEITNDDGATTDERRGVEVSGSNFGTMNHIYLKNLTIHDVKGTVGNTLADKKSAAIYFTVEHDDSKDTRYNDILVEGCEIYDIQNQGIVTNNETSAADYPGSTDWMRRRITNLNIRNNTIYNITKNAMIVRLADGGLVEHNLCHDTSYGVDDGGNAIGGNIMFSRSSQNTIFQYNEGYNNKGFAVDGSMYDPDYSSPGVIFQYSYSHDNAAGLLWVCTSPQDVGVVCRYNVSQNDKGALVYFNYDFTDVKVYNNTFYIGPGLAPKIIQENTTRDHTYQYYNNIVYNDPANSSNPANNTGAPRFAFANTGIGVQNRTITDNLFYRTPTPSQINTGTNSTADPLFVEVNKATTGLNTVGGYKLKPGSPALGTGKTIADNGGKDYFGITVSSTAQPNMGFYNGPGTLSATIDANFHVYLLTGQSNMSGRGYLTDDTYNLNPDPRIKMLKLDGTWVTALNPLHGELESDAGVGPGIGFALEMLKDADPNVTIGLIPTAVGGQPISVFAPGVTNPRTNKSIYDESVKYVNIAKTTGVLKGILFHQGESNNSTTSAWVNGVKALINNFRSDFNDPKLPFIIGEMGRFPGNPNKYSSILAVMPGLVADVPYTALVSSAGLVDRGDETHFNTASAYILGQRYAVAMKSVQATLPITLVKFKASKKNDGALIQWSTSSEINNDRFELEHSVDGKTFQKITVIKGNGTSNQLINYSYLDKNPDNGVNYYRLVQYDLDGKKSTSDVVALTFSFSNKGNDFEIFLYPNPAKDKIFVNLKAKPNQQIKMAIYNLQGQQLRQLKFSANELVQENIQDLGPGVYILRVQDADSGELIGESKFIKY